jgi:predicted TIM-barrel fold metal-dependent hydrolase
MEVSATDQIGSKSSQQRFRVIDIDTHLIEPESIWAEYLPVGYRSVAPRIVIDSDGYRRTCMGGITMGRDGMPSPDTPANWASLERGGFEPDARLEAMDAEGIEAMVLYPTMANKFGGLRDIETAAVFCRAYNNWVNDFRAPAPSRLLPMAVVPQLSVAETLAETRRAVGQLGLPGVLLRPNPVGGRTLDDPAWEPLWFLLEELRVPLGLHEGTSGAFIPTFGQDRTQNFMFRHMVSHPFEQMMAMLQLIGGGVLDRHPDLRVCFVEAGCGWVPYWLERMEHHMKEWAHMTFPLALHPTEYFWRQCFVSTDSEEEAGLNAVLDTVGPDGICWSTDYPHSDHVWKGVADSFTNRTDLSDEVKAKVIGENAARAFNL